MDHVHRHSFHVFFQDIFLTMASIIIASQSHRRKQLIDWADVGRDSEINLLKDTKTQNECVAPVCFRLFSKNDRPKFEHMYRPQPYAKHLGHFGILNSHRMGNTCQH